MTWVIPSRTTAGKRSSPLPSEEEIPLSLPHSSGSDSSVIAWGRGMDTQEPSSSRRTSRISLLPDTSTGIRSPAFMPFRLPSSRPKLRDALPQNSPPIISIRPAAPRSGLSRKLACSAFKSSSFKMAAPTAAYNSGGTSPSANAVRFPAGSAIVIFNLNSIM